MIPLTTPLTPAAGQPAGIVVARCEHLHCSAQYKLRFLPKDGAPVEHWWRAEQLSPEALEPTAAPISTPIAARYPLGAELRITCSDERGQVIGRGDSTDGEATYLLRYMQANGIARDEWWPESAIDDRLRTGVVFAAALQPGQPPAIGQKWPEQGGIYAGLSRGANGEPDAHLILSTVEPSEDLSWDDAVAWAKALRDEGLDDWRLPTRSESALLFANLRDLFPARWHWTSEQPSRTYAWNQDFDVGTQYFNVKSDEGRARAVRRLILQPFSPSQAA